MILVSIDPGYAKGVGCAWAYFDYGELTLARFQDPSRSVALKLRPHIVVVERPQMDARSRAVTPKGHIALAWAGAIVAGRFAGDCAPIVELTPQQWKGSEHKPQHHWRLWEVLTDAERRVLGGGATEQRIDDACRRGALERWRRPGGAYYSRSWTTHNLLDAAALGCYYLGRLDRRQ